MARDIEAEVKVKDSTGPGLKSAEENFKRTGKNIEKEYDRFGKSTGDKLIKGIGAVSPKIANALGLAVGDGARVGAPLLLAGIGAAAPLIGGLIGAAVTGGSAGLGIVGGVALAVRDARVKQAGTTLGTTLLSGLTDRAGSFIQPVLNSIDVMEDAFVRSGDRIRNIFSNSSRFVEPLARALAGLGENLLEGLDIAVGRAGPVMTELNRGIDGTGRAIKSFLDQVSASSEGNAAALRDTFEAINAVILVAGPLVRALSEIYGALDKIGLTGGLLQSVARLLDDTGESGRRSAAGTFGAAQGMQIAGDAAETAAEDTRLFEKALQDNARAAQEAARAQSSLFDDTTRVGAAMDDAAAAAKRNGKTLDANTSKGRANRTALSQLAGSMNNYRTNLEKTGASSTRVNGVLGTQRAAFIRVATQMTGNAAKARQLANQLLGIPAKRETKTNLLNAAKTKREAREVKAATDAIPRNIPVNISVITRGLTAAREAVNLRREMLSLSRSGGSFSLAETGGGRVGGPSQIFGTVENFISIDGTPFRRSISNQFRAYDARQRHRRRYGGRYT
jgi:hypothetical protein